VQAASSACLLPKARLPTSPQRCWTLALAASSTLRSPWHEAAEGKEWAGARRLCLPAGARFGATTAAPHSKFGARWALPRHRHVPSSGLRVVVEAGEGRAPVWLHGWRGDVCDSLTS